MITLSSIAATAPAEPILGSLRNTGTANVLLAGANGVFGYSLPVGAELRFSTDTTSQLQAQLATAGAVAGQLSLMVF